MSRRMWMCLFGVITVYCFAQDAYGQAVANTEQEAVAAIEALGGRIYRMPDGSVDIVDLKGDTVTDAQLALLRPLTSLRILSLEGSQVTDAGLRQLHDLPNLEEVSLRGTQVTPAGAAALKEQHPKIYRVETDPGLRPARLVVAVVLIPLGLFGGFLMRLTHRKRSVLNPRLYARGMGMGLLLVLASVVMLAVALLQALGFDFSLSELFG